MAVLDHMTNGANSAGVPDLYQGIQHAHAEAHDKPGMLALNTVDGSGSLATYYLWVDSSGSLRIANAIPTNQDSSGTVVGTQT
jgi:hypothetical protein